MMRNLAILSMLLILLPFQACTNQLVFSTLGGNALTAGINGEGYGGKPTPYDFADQNSRCSEIGANGKPLPNSQIFLFASGLAQLVRENCTDIQPRPLSSQEYSVDSSGNILYHNQIFIPNVNQTPFDVVAASCPAGKTMLTNPVRLSLMREPLDLQASMWEHPGLAVNLEGSLASLPLYQVQRNDPNALESWHRMAQSLIFETGQSYVFSFYVKPDATEKVMFTSYYPNLQDFRVEFDLITGAATVYSTIGVNLISTKAQNFAGGLYINIYFQAQNNVHANIGMASSGQFLGSSVSATALQVEKLSNFCTP
jgi:hypothetical protein